MMRSNGKIEVGDRQYTRATLYDAVEQRLAEAVMRDDARELMAALVKLEGDSVPASRRELQLLERAERGARRLPEPEPAPGPAPHDDAIAAALAAEEEKKGPHADAMRAWLSEKQAYRDLLKKRASTGELEAAIDRIEAAEERLHDASMTLQRARAKRLQLEAERTRWRALENYRRTARK